MTGRVEVRRLSHAFGTVAALAGVDLDVGEGEFVAVLGPSGCGKSTLLRVLAGLVVPTEGTATIDGYDVRGRPGRTAYQPQRDALIPWRRVLDNAALGAALAGVPEPEARTRADEILTRFGLGGFSGSWPVELSGGMRQRVAVARTVLVDRAPLLLDEPFGALDAITRRGLYEWFAEIWSTDRRSALLVTHDLDEALTLADRVVVLSPRPGRVTADVEVPSARPRRPTSASDPAWARARGALLAALASDQGQ